MISYDIFMKKYAEQHYCCPKCFSRNFSSTLAGYAYNSEHPEEYKDRNRCHCYDCGWTGIRHNLVPNPDKYKLYKYKGIKTGGNIYSLITDNFIFKDNDVWRKELCLYKTEYYNPNGEYFARTREDFYENFEEINKNKN